MAERLPVNNAVTKETSMQQPPSVWHIALGTMIGNIGCVILNALLACILFAILSVAGAGFMNQILSQLTR